MLRGVRVRHAIARVGAMLGLVVGLAALTGYADAAPSPEAVHPDAGVGRARLGDTPTEVRRQLGRGTSVAPGFRRHRSGRISLIVGVSKRHRVDSFATQSPAATLYGRPLSDGFKRLAPRLRRGGWRTTVCNSMRISVHHHGKATTRIQWESGRFAQLDIGIGAPSNGCALGSPTNPAP